MKKCPKCELNWIKDDEELCSVCKNEQSFSTISINTSKNYSPFFQEYFTFKKPLNQLRGKTGYQAFNSKGQNVGIVFMTDIKTIPSYGYCELCMRPDFYNKYGEWHRIKSHGEKIKWSVLCDALNKQSEYKIFVD